MKVDRFSSWLQRYKRAWENRDPHAAQELFTENATYQETPFTEPLRGREAIYAYWSDVPNSQDQVRFESNIIAVTEQLCVAWWHASFIRIPNKARVTLDGIFVFSLNEAGLCTEFREWWHRQE
ncbi:hypothetical protein RxyAA322_03370 [Rubrobacter xylanophilus]|uniref:SnoaL-like domain-containing protein n=1 Tax=Rubrobacter xylanophilus TaxID=49319 RepID=A0A510HIJ6_9ACTN|nr:hypothetical protein RxyAA322_03370 [Rubrobacter xylanophilus]